MIVLGAGGGLRLQVAIYLGRGLDQKWCFCMTSAVRSTAIKPPRDSTTFASGRFRTR